MKRIKNFGRNISFESTYYEPASEAQVLEILEKHAEDKIRVIGSLHSWNDILISEQVILRMNHFNNVEIVDGGKAALVGGGCQLKTLLTKLKKAGNYTLPTMGAVLQQTIAGATATGTHGSGNRSMSDFITGVKVAYLNSENQAVCEWITDKKMLAAARCNLGCMGVILEIKISIVEQYFVEEKILEYNEVGEIIKSSENYPMQQFLLIPYSWKFFSYSRKMAEKQSRSWYAPFYRLIDFLTVDVFFHLLVKTMVSIFKAPGVLQKAFDNVPSYVFKRKILVRDDSRNALTLRHDLFTHVEMELFIPQSELPQAVKHTRDLIEYFSGKRNKISDKLYDRIAEENLLIDLQNLKGKYIHHYPLFFRRVLPDQNTLISMTADREEPRYTMSFFTYAPDIDDFRKMAVFVARLYLKLHHAVPHWGKFFPLRYHEIKDEYPKLEEFRTLCNKIDKKGMFRNNYAQRVLGFQS